MSTRTMFQYSFGDIVEHAATLHHHHTTGNLVCFVSRCKLLYGKGSQSVYAHGAHRDVSSTACVARTIKTESVCSSPRTSCPPVAHRTQGSGRKAGGRTYRELGSLIDELSDCGYVTENTRVDGGRCRLSWDGKWECRGGRILHLWER